MDLKKIHLYLHTFCRYFLATIILSYAFAKILGTQFTAQPSTYDKPVGSLSGFELTWFYYGYSFWYGLTIAAIQITSSLCLFFRKTTRIGIVLFLSFMVNILFVDYAYDIQGAKGMASILTLMALFVFFSEFQLFWKYFIEQPPLFPNEQRPPLFNKMSKAKWLYIPVVFFGLFLSISYLKSKFMSKNEFYGTWQNLDKTSPWYKIDFEFANTFQIYSACNENKTESGSYAVVKDSLKLLSFTREYQKKLNEDKTNAILNPDPSKMIVLLKGKYQMIGKNKLSIVNGTKTFFFKRVR